MLTIGSVIPVFPSVRCKTGPFAVGLTRLASSRSVCPNTVAAPAHTIGFTMNSRRFHSCRLFMTLLLKWRCAFCQFLAGAGSWQTLRRRLQNLSPILRWLQQENQVVFLINLSFIDEIRKE